MSTYLIWLLSTSGGLLAGFVAGRWSKRQPDAVCGCNHHLAHHDPKTRQGKAAIEVKLYSDRGTKLGKAWEDCACQCYVGPLPEHFVSNIIEMGSEASA